MPTTTTTTTNNTEKEPTPKPTVLSTLRNAFWRFIYLLCYIALGLTLCYFKIIFGDLCRTPSIDHAKFTNAANPYLVTKPSTTPAAPYYSKEDGKYFVKQLFTENPNFITVHAQSAAYTEHETSQILKTFFLETSYVMFSFLNLLQHVPDWLIVVIHPLLWAILFFAMSIFTWLISSLNIFLYCLKPEGIFAKLYLGWISGFFFWFVLMCLWGALTVPVANMAGLFQLFLLLSKQKVRVLNPDPLPDTGSSSPYSFSMYFVDMLKTSPVIHVMLLYTLYNMVETVSMAGNSTFGKQFTYAFLALLVILLAWNKGRFNFFTGDQLKAGFWTSQVDSISIPFTTPSVATVMGRMVEPLGERIPSKKTGTEPEASASSPLPTPSAAASPESPTPSTENLEPSTETPASEPSPVNPESSPSVSVNTNK